MSEEDPDQKVKPEKKASIWPVVISIGTIVVLSLIAQEVDKENPGSGRLVFGWFFGIGALLVFLHIMWSTTLKGIGENIASLVKAIVGILVAAFVLAGLGKCSSNSSPGIAPSNEGAYPDNIRK